MKSHIFKIALIILTVSAVTALAGPPIRTDVVGPSGPTLTVIVLDKRIVRIINFVHEGATPGSVTLTKGGQTGKVMTSVPAENEEVRKLLLIAGPATLSVAAVAGSTLTISYQLESNPPD